MENSTLTNTGVTLPTTIHMYRYNLDYTADAQAYKELRAAMKARGTKCFESWGGKEAHYRPELDGLTVELETTYLFDNQWNTVPIAGVTDKGLRVFDWAQDYIDDKRIKKGYWLDLTPAMVEVRGNRVKCGYCRKQYDKRDTPAPPAFCHACVGSEYLKLEDLKLLRVQSLGAREFPPLTDEETAYLVPLYRAEQTGKGSERSRLQRARLGERLHRKYKETVAEATTEYEGMKWLFYRGCSIRLMENCIYYRHKDVFTFGWRDKLAEGEDLDWLMENMSEFPGGRWNVITAHRGTIGGVE